MGATGRRRLFRWKLSFLRHAPPPSPSPSPSVPPEFLCPVSGLLMADPVILASGDTFDRSSLAESSASAGCSDGQPQMIIPNAALKAAIFSWCDSHGVPRPSQTASPALSVRTRRPDVSSVSSSSSHSSSSSSCPSSEMQESGKQEGEEEGVAKKEAAKAADISGRDAVEEDFCAKMADLDILEPEEVEAAVAAVRVAARDGLERRLSLCTPRLLSFLRPLLLSRHAGVQANAAAALVNLSVEKANKILIVRSGAVTTLVDVLKIGSLEAREHAAGTLFSLALEESNRAAIGVLGAVPPLIQMFSGVVEASRARRDAGLALYHLSLAAANLTKIIRSSGAPRMLLAVAAEDGLGETAALRRVALMIVCNLTSCAEGRVALLDAGAVSAVTRIMADGNAGEEEEWCVSAMYGMSRGSLRFRGLAREAGTEKALLQVAERSNGLQKDMARKTLRAMRTDADGEFIVPESSRSYWEGGDCGGDDGDSIVSEGTMSFRRRHWELGVAPCAPAASSSNTAEF